MVLSLKKGILMIGFIIIIILFTAFVWGYIFQNNQAHSDRSNAIQVAKPIVTDPGIQTAPDFFTEYRLEREKIRSERSDLLRETIKNAHADEIRNKAQETVLKITLDKQRESEMETLIKARGFSDALVFIRENSVSAIIKTSSLAKEDVIHVADTIVRITGVKQEDITISARN